MNVYFLALFAHIVSAIAVFIGMGLEWVSLLRLRGAQTVAQVREYTSLTSVQAKLVVGGAAVLFVAGVYMTITRWGWQTPWIQIALGTLILEAALGGVVHTPRFKAIYEAASKETTNFLPEELKRKIDDPILWLSVHAHGITALGVIFLMTNKPDLIGSLITLVVTLVLSAITAQLWRPRRHTTARTGFAG